MVIIISSELGLMEMVMILKLMPKEESQMFKLLHNKLISAIINSITLLLDSQVTVSNAIGLVNFKLMKVVFMNSELAQMMVQDLLSMVFQL